MPSITVTPDPLTAGGTATVCVSGASAAPVVVNIDDGLGNTSSVTITTLDDDGHGCASWSVPMDWGLANFNWDGAQEVTRPIQQPG